MILNKFAYFYSKPLGNHTLKNIEKKTWKFTKKTWKNHGILSVRKSGNPAGGNRGFHVRRRQPYILSFCFSTNPIEP